MLIERVDNVEDGYRCNRCKGMFGSRGEDTVRCPFCSAVCDEIKCRVVEMSNEEY